MRRKPWCPMTGEMGKIKHVITRCIERRHVTDEREYIAEGVGSRVLNSCEEFLCSRIFKRVKYVVVRALAGT